MNETPKPLGAWHMLGLHLIPGALITAFFFLIAPAVMRAGFPAYMAIMLAILLILIPFELGFLLYQGKKRNGRFSLEGIVLFREHTPAWQTILLVLVLFVWSGLMFGLLPKVDDYFVRTWFAWFPTWSLPGNMLGDSSQYSKTALTLSLLAGLALNGIAGPIVEELYFRGYLLPRIPASRWWAPLINVLLFSLYHFFSPWQNVTRILALIPLVYAVAWKRNISISMWTHCILNTVGMASALALLFQ
jgi:membrane protease YdiL (CAAX protease family)